MFYLFTFFFIGKLRTHLVGFEPKAWHSTLLLKGNKVPFELELIGIIYY